MYDEQVTKFNCSVTVPLPLCILRTSIISRGGGRGVHNFERSTVLSTKIYKIIQLTLYHGIYEDTAIWETYLGYILHRTSGLSSTSLA